MPSTEEAFGTAYIEAMAAGVPAIGCRGEPGPEEIAAAGGGFLLVPPGDIERLSQRIDELLSDPHRLREASERARATVRQGFTWEHCGQQTLAAYREVLARARSGHGPAAVSAGTKPVLFVTGHLPAYRVGAFARLHERAGLEVALFGGARRHGGPDPSGELPFPARHVRPHELYRLAASGRYRAVVCPTGGRAALLASWAGARAGRVPADPVGLAVGPPAHAGPPAQLPAAAAPVPLGAGGRHLRAPRQRLRPPPWRGQRVRGAPGGGQRVLVGPAGRRAPAAGLAAGRSDAVRVRRAPGRARRGCAVLLDAWARAALPASCALVLVGPSRRPTGRRRRPTATLAGGAGASIHELGRLEPAAAARGLRPRGGPGRAVDSHARASASPGGWWSTRP